MRRRACALALLCLPFGPAAAEPAPGASAAAAAALRAGRTAREWMDEGYRRKARGELIAAASAFQSARAGGFDPQRVELELGYLAAQRGDAAAVRSSFQAAASGPDADLASRARAELRESWVREASLRRSQREFGGARAALHEARQAGLDPQRAELELAYLAMAENDLGDAREHLSQAAVGPDPAAASRAREELSQLPSPVWRDFYSEVYGWDRFSGAPRPSDAVPTFRIRAGYRLPIDLDAGPYLYAQATRDLASTGAGADALPQLYADNTALLGAGLLLRLWDRRLGLFVQAGPALSLIDDGRQHLAFDARAGATLALETSRCWPSPASGARLGFAPCAELYSEVVYLSRFADNVVGLARGRVAATWLVTGPWAWQLAGEVRAAADRNHDYFNNFVEGGVGPRLRLLRPFRLDLFPSLGAGSYLGLAGRDPAPHPLSYLEFRLQMATSFEF